MKVKEIMSISQATIKKRIDKMKKRRGLTLIEVIVSLAIIGIIAMVFLSTFSSSIKNIFATKSSIEDFYTNEEKIDREIKKVENPEYLDQDQPTVIKVNINGKSIEVPGKLIKESNESIDGGDEDRFQITTFVPYRKSTESEDD